MSKTIFFCQNHLRMVFFFCHVIVFGIAGFCCFDPSKWDFNVHLCKLKISTFENIEINRNHVHAFVCVFVRFFLVLNITKTGCVERNNLQFSPCIKVNESNQEKCWYISSVSQCCLVKSRKNTNRWTKSSEKKTMGFF